MWRWFVRLRWYAGIGMDCTGPCGDGCSEYVESVTVVKGVDVTKDEVRTFTAGLVIVLDQHIATKTAGDADVVEGDLWAQVDAEEVLQAIAALRKNEEVREKLATLKRENDRLHRELESVSRGVNHADTSVHMATTVRRRQEILYRAQSNDVLSQAWIGWALASSARAAHLPARHTDIQVLLRSARDLDPGNPHIAAATRIMAEKPPLSPPRPPSPPMPGQAPARMPKYEIVPAAGLGGAPRTLNEVLYETPKRQS